MRYAKGIMWLENCRIPFVDNDIPTGGYGSASIGYGNEYEYSGGAGKSNTQGRFTPNLLVCDDVLNDGSVSKTNTRGQTRSEKRTLNYFVVSNETEMAVIQDKGSSSRYYDLDKWFSKMVDEIR